MSRKWAIACTVLAHECYIYKILQKLVSMFFLHCALISLYFNKPRILCFLEIAKPASDIDVLVGNYEVNVARLVMLISTDKSKNIPKTNIDRNSFG